ncbi:MAG: response regulator [Planctomycetota bacterium]
MTLNEHRTILVIDNDQELTRALTKRLGSVGFRCIATESGLQGLAEFRRGGIDLVVTDLNMPGGDGVMLAETIRKTSAVPIIFITGFREDFKRRLRHVQNVSTLQKPFMSHDLVDLITTALGQDSLPASPAHTTPETA